MLGEVTVADRLLETIARVPSCLLEELLVACSDLTWNQVFLGIDRLSRTGQVRLTLESAGIYRVRLINKAIPEARDAEAEGARWPQRPRELAQVSRANGGMT